MIRCHGISWMKYTYYGWFSSDVAFFNVFYGKKSMDEKQRISYWLLLEMNFFQKKRKNKIDLYTLKCFSFERIAIKKESFMSFDVKQYDPYMVRSLITNLRYKAESNTDSRIDRSGHLTIIYEIMYFVFVSILWIFSLHEIYSWRIFYGKISEDIHRSRKNR